MCLVINASECLSLVAIVGTWSDQGIIRMENILPAVLENNFNDHAIFIKEEEKCVNFSSKTQPYLFQLNKELSQGQKNKPHHF